MSPRAYTDLLLCALPVMHILCINYCYIQKEGTIFNPSSIASLFSHFVMEGFVKYSVCNVYTFIQLLAPTKSYLSQTFTCLFCGQLSPSHIKHKLSVNESQRREWVSLLVWPHSQWGSLSLSLIAYRLYTCWFMSKAHVQFLQYVK